MRIASVETIPIRVPLVRPFHGSHYHMTHRSTIVVRITTDDGIVGEAYAGDEDASLLEIDRIVNDELAPKLVGEDAYAIERCWELCRPATFDILRDRRIGLVACACVDAALWDAVGKALAQPLWRLWGGYRSRLPMIAIGGYYDAGADLRTEVKYRVPAVDRPAHGLGVAQFSRDHLDLRRNPLIKPIERAAVVAGVVPHEGAYPRSLGDQL